MRGNLKMRSSSALLLIAGALALVACDSSSTASPTPTAGNLPTSAAATPSSAATPSGVATTLDPCQLVTSAEASSLAGASYGAGVAQTYDGGSKGCIYGYQTLNVFSVLVASADSPTTAQADWTQEQARAQALLAQVTASSSSISISTNDVSNVQGADKAAVGSGSFSVSGHTFGVAVMYLIKGPNFVTFSDIVVGQAGPSTGALESQAATVIGRMP